VSYIEEAVESLKSIMLGSKDNILEVLSSAYKGEVFVLKYLASREFAPLFLPSALGFALPLTVGSSRCKSADGFNSSFFMRRSIHAGI
jgi:hypothetical protein